MLRYLIVLLDDNAVSYCVYSPQKDSGKQITPNVLRQAIVWAMKENLSLHFVYSKDCVSPEIASLITSVEHTDIGPSDADIVVIENWNDITAKNNARNGTFIIHTKLEDILIQREQISSILKLVDRINIMITDIEFFPDSCIGRYRDFLMELIPTIVDEYKVGHQVQLNLLTDRLMLKKMNNCNAGYETITLAPDGNLYVCPAFYINNEESIGDIYNGIKTKNPQLYKLEYAPICRTCDSFQCKRCIWLNKKLCHEVNTPSHQQCVLSHIERNASRKLLEEFRKIDNSCMSEIDIPEVEYLDPFDKLINKYNR